MTEKTGVIGGMDLPEKAEHTREKRKRGSDPAHIQMRIRINMEIWI